MKQREIKFRAWDKEEKIMYRVNSLRFWHNRQHVAFVIVDVIEKGVARPFTIPEESVELMQCTGLLDKNGKEIYEMDILKVDWGGLNDEYIKVNKYDKPFVMEWRGYEYPPFSRYLPMPKDIEVIGNIYENPELLNK